MSVRTIIDNALELAPSRSEASILEILNRGQNFICNKDTFFTRYEDPTTGFPQYITTENDKLGPYSVPNVNITIGGTVYSCRMKRIDKVFIDVTNYKDYDRRWLGEPFQYISYNPYTPATDKLLFSAIPMHCDIARENTACVIVFAENPAASTAKYYTQGIVEPPQITSDSIPLFLPEDYEDDLMEYVLAWVDKFDNGKPERLEKWKEVAANQIWFELSEGAQAYSDFTPIREM